jgi:FkbM family methyltransferase
MFAAVRHLGLRNYLRFRALRLRDKWQPRDELLTLISNEARYPLVARGNTSDLSVFSGVFVRRAYANLACGASPGLIIDCGANVGYSSAYFLSRFPVSRVVAVEPDPTNFALLQENLAPYGDAVRAINSAVWSHPAGLVIEEAPYRDGRQWSRQVRECRPGEPATMIGVDVGTLLADSGYARISILKMDVEGAEAVVFARNYEDWIERVDVLAIELHDDSCFGDSTTIFRRAMDRRGFTYRRRGELTLCRRAA